MSDLWRVAGEASRRFAAQAVDYDRCRPRYPESVFDDIVDVVGLGDGDSVIEIGAGTGIATEPLVDRGLRVTAVEPAAELAEVAQAKLGERARFVNDRFESCWSFSPARLVAAFNAWHWVDAGVAVDLVARLLEPDGALALVWTEVVAWGQDPFEERLADIFGSVWPKREEHVDGSLQPIRDDRRFEDLQVSHHLFERELDAATFIAVTKTYGRGPTEEQYEAIRRVIDEECSGAVRKVEDASLYVARRR